MVSVFQHYRAAPSCPVSDRRDRGVPPFFSADSQLRDIIIEGGGASYHRRVKRVCDSYSLRPGCVLCGTGEMSIKLYAAVTIFFAAA